LRTGGIGDFTASPLDQFVEAVAHLGHDSHIE
jgi:hypothetical protein